jgi:PAS domain-containing protein
MPQSNFLPEVESRLIGDIYDAAMSPNLWQGLMARLTEHWQCEYASLLISDELNPDYLIVHSHGVSPEQLSYYQAGQFTEFEKRLAQGYLDSGLPIGQAAANHKAFGGIENFISTAGPLYTDFFEKLGMKYQVGSVLEKTDYRHSIISLHDGRKRQQFTDVEVAAISRLTGHMHRAIQIHRQFSYVKESNAALYQLLNKMVAGVLLLDYQGRVRFANPNAENLMREHDALAVSRNHHLETTEEEKESSLQRAINSAIKSGLREKQEFSLMAGGVISLKGSKKDTMLILTITPLSEMTGYKDLSSDGIAASIFITDPLARRSLSRRILEQTYQLTRRETDACESFLNTGTLTNVADELGLTIDSTRYYFKSIYDKTQQHSQAELMRLLMGLTMDFEHVPDI